MWTQVQDALRQSTERMLTAIASVLPGILILLMAVVPAAVLGWLVRVMVHRILRALDFDARLGRWGLAGLVDWSAPKSPSRLVAGVGFWVVVLAGLLVGVTALSADLGTRMLNRFIEYLPSAMAAVVVLIVGTVLARFLARGVLISAVNMHIQYARLLSLGVKWLVLVLTVAMALEHLAIGGEIVRLSFAILFGGIVLALAL